MCASSPAPKIQSIRTGLLPAVATIQHSSLPHKATLCHDRLRDPHGPELVFLANLAMRATASALAYVADLKPHLERCILKSALPLTVFGAVYAKRIYSSLIRRAREARYGSWSA